MVVLFHQRKSAEYCWRIDYFLVSEATERQTLDAEIHDAY